MSLTALTALRAHTMDNTDHCHVPSVDLLLSRSAAAERSRGHGPSDLAPADARPGARVIPHASSFAALFFFLNDRAPPEISPLPLPAPLPIAPPTASPATPKTTRRGRPWPPTTAPRGPARSRPGRGRRRGTKRGWRSAGRRGCASRGRGGGDRKSTRLNSSHSQISYAVFCLKK